MTQREIILIQESFKAIALKGDDVVKTFYTKLFELNPGLRPLFTPNTKEQRGKLIAMIQLLVLSLRNFEELTPFLEDLGRKHINYSVKEEDYGILGKALLWTLERFLEESFTEEVKVAWTEFYIILSMKMKNAATTVSA